MTKTGGREARRGIWGRTRRTSRVTFTRRIQRWSHSVAVPTAGNASVTSASSCCRQPAGRRNRVLPLDSKDWLPAARRDAQNKHPRRHLRIASASGVDFPVSR